MPGRESPRSEEKAHDVLAAEEFPVPAPDPTLRHGPIALPDDPSGIEEPHDVLAAEEFALPAPRPAAAPEGASGSIAARARTPARIAFLLGVAVALLRALRRRRSA
jgi:hypothetical protein